LEDVAKSTPVIGIVSRLVTQKGFDILARAGDELASRKVAVVALGTGEPIYENFFRDWASRHPANVAVEIRYDDALAHKIEAGADMFLMPSRYEPCGLNQIYSLKYGAVPVVRATGGLDNTIEEWDAAKSAGTGFKFDGYEPANLLAAVDRALAAFGNKPAWTKLMKNGMAQYFGWEEPARQYAEVYEKAAQLRA
jgi:starch synthase